MLTKNSNSNTRLSNEKIQFDKDFLENVEVERMTTIKSLKSDLDNNDNYESLRYIVGDKGVLDTEGLFNIENSILIIPVINQNNSIDDIIQKKIILEVPNL